MQLRDFDSVAARWDQEPRRVQLARAVADAIVAEAHPDSLMRLLDFGAGTGLVTLALAPLVNEIVAADSSQGMLQQLTAKLADAGIDNVRPLLIRQDAPAELPGRFDLVVSSMVMHHIEDVGTLLKQFRSSLVAGGRLCIADLDAEDGSFHDDPTGIRHHGFSVTEMERLFKEAGFEAVRTIPVFTVSKQRQGAVQDYPVNMTIATV